MHLAYTPEANQFLVDDPFALLIGMLLDQQIPIEKAFTSPYELQQRLGHDLDVREIAEYDPAAVWSGAADGADLVQRVSTLPGFGDQKARIFVALLGKQFDVQPPGWRAAAGDYGDEGAHRSVADIVDDDSLSQVRAFKQQLKAAAKAKPA